MLRGSSSQVCSRLPRSKAKLKHTTQLYLGAREEVEAQSVHGEELAAVRSEEAVEAEVPSLGRS